jgi:hypothetical protein
MDVDVVEDADVDVDVDARRCVHGFLTGDEGAPWRRYRGTHPPLRCREATRFDRLGDRGVDQLRTVLEQLTSPSRQGVLCPSPDVLCHFAVDDAARLTCRVHVRRSSARTRIDVASAALLTRVLARALALEWVEPCAPADPDLAGA